MSPAYLFYTVNLVERNSLRCGRHVDMAGRMKGETMNDAISRRGFLGGAIAAGAAAGVSGMVSTASADEASSWQPATWDYETDILIVGLGGSGAAAAITAADESLGDVLVCEAAPEGFEGGNTAIAQGVIFSGTDRDGLVTYQKNLNGAYSVPEDRLQAWADGLMENVDWLKSIGADPQPTQAYSPEYPDIDGSEYAQCYLNEGTIGKGVLWNPIKAKFDSTGTTVLYDTRVVDLIQNPITGEVCGAATESGQTIKARKGVLLACGGFLFDEQLTDTYYPVGFKRCTTSGTPYGRGDGVKMAMKAGCNLWHMNNYATGTWVIEVPFEEGNDDSLYMGQLLTTASDKDYIYVGPNGNRFIYEECVSDNRHGKEIKNDMYVQMTGVYPAYLIMGHNVFDNETILYSGSEYTFAQVHGVGKTLHEYLDAGIIQTADTVEELAEKLGLDPATLANTVNTYNENAANNEDPEFGRGQEVAARGFKMYLGTGEANDTSTPLVSAFDLVPLEPPFYGVQIVRAGVNSQGGPERDATCNVLRPDGTGIPRLYTAGELGAIYPYMYNGGGNIAEAFATGRIAARSIGGLEPWE